MVLVRSRGTVGNKAQRRTAVQRCVPNASTAGGSPTPEWHAVSRPPPPPPRTAPLRPAGQLAGSDHPLANRRHQLLKLRIRGLAAASKCLHDGRLTEEPFGQHPRRHEHLPAHRLARLHQCRKLLSKQAAVRLEWRAGGGGGGRRRRGSMGGGGTGPGNGTDAAAGGQGREADLRGQLGAA